MANAVALNSRKKAGFQYGSYFASRKRAVRSKNVKGIIIKKRKPESSRNDFSSSDQTDENSESSSKKSDIKRRRVSVLCESTNHQYESLDVIGSGGYGIVHKARDVRTGEIVAIKEQSGGVSTSSTREIYTLENLLPHPSIVEFKEAVVDDYEDTVYVVMEYLEHDLRRYLKSKKDHKPFNLNEVKRLMKQLLEGVRLLHSNDLMHRDLKPANILVDTTSGNVNIKICDFGLCRYFGNKWGSCTPGAGTLWYRAPEILLGAKDYSSAVDMWSVGCIMAELLSCGQVLFRGESELEQINCVYRILGTPNEDVWPGFSRLPGSRATFVQEPYNLLRDKFPMLTEVGFDLLNRLLSYDPERRITARDALNHVWFEEGVIN